MNLIKLFKNFFVDEELIAYKQFGNGHINSTFLGLSNKNNFYIIQKINRVAFKDVDLLMNNISCVTTHLKNKNQV